ncbi:MAG: penicillin acylase family protein [Chloroflexi bacterium]|nr:penicillin acylase family protein [Chloroflexota bacterium]
MVVHAGDCYIQIVEFSAAGVTSRAIHQYGNVNRKNSPHYADQAPIWADTRLLPMLFDWARIEKEEAGSVQRLSPAK